MSASGTTTSERLLTNDEVADRLNLPHSTLRYYRMKGTGPKAVKLGKSVRYRWSDIEDWLKENEDG